MTRIVSRWQKKLLQKVLDRWLARQLPAETRQKSSEGPDFRHMRAAPEASSGNGCVRIRTIVVKRKRCCRRTCNVWTRVLDAADAPGFRPVATLKVGLENRKLGSS